MQIIASDVGERPFRVRIFWKVTIPWGEVHSAGNFGWSNMRRTTQRVGAPQAPPSGHEQPTMMDYVRRLEARLCSLEARPRARGESQLHPDLLVRHGNAPVGFSPGNAIQQPPGLDQTHELTPPSGNGSNRAHR